MLLTFKSIFWIWGFLYELILYTIQFKQCQYKLDAEINYIKNQ